jgi:hypothetical protein
MPELIGGRLEEVVVEIWELQREALLKVSYLGVPAPSPHEWNVIFTDFDCAKINILSQLRLKTDYMRRLPVLMLGLAHVCEEKARDICKLVIQSFNVDPRREAHDERTWKLLRPGSYFAEDMALFCNGASRSDLREASKKQVARFRFPSAVETTIEEKHARVAIARKAHHLGPVRASMANRLPMLERLLRRGHINIRELLECFEQARSLHSVPGLLGLELHPRLLGIRGTLVTAHIDVPRRSKGCKIEYENETTLRR